MNGSANPVTERLPREVLPDLEWVKTESGHELRSASLVFARFWFEHRFRSGDEGFADTVDRRWKISHRNWRELVVWDRALDQKVAVMNTHGDAEGVLLHPDLGQPITRLHWSSWTSTWDTEDDWMIRYHNTSEFRKTQARVEVDPDIVHLIELPLLITVGWYLWLSGWEDSGDDWFILE